MSPPLALGGGGVRERRGKGTGPKIIVGPPIGSRPFSPLQKFLCLWAGQLDGVGKEGGIFSRFFKAGWQVEEPCRQAWGCVRDTGALLFPGPPTPGLSHPSPCSPQVFGGFFFALQLCDEDEPGRKETRWSGRFQPLSLGVIATWQRDALNRRSLLGQKSRQGLQSFSEEAPVSQDESRSCPNAPACMG